MIYLAADHGGYTLKEQVKAWLMTRDIEVSDLGPRQLQIDDDYPDYIIPLAERVAKEQSRGIISCRNGQGAAIIANKVSGVRAAVCWSESVAKTARTDDDTNILSLPADFTDLIEAEKIINTWLDTPFSGDARHARRLAKISDYEQTREGHVHE